MAAVIKIPRQHTKDPETNQRRALGSRDWCGPMREAGVPCVWLVAVSMVLLSTSCKIFLIVPILINPSSTVFSTRTLYMGA